MPRFQRQLVAPVEWSVMCTRSGEQPRVTSQLKDAVPAAIDMTEMNNKQVRVTSFIILFDRVYVRRSLWVLSSDLFITISVLYT